MTFWKKGDHNIFLGNNRNFFSQPGEGRIVERVYLHRGTVSFQDETRTENENRKCMHKEAGVSNTNTEANYANQIFEELKERKAALIFSKI